MVRPPFVKKTRLPSVLPVVAAIPLPHDLNPIVQVDRAGDAAQFVPVYNPRNMRGLLFTSWAIAEPFDIEKPVAAPE